MINLLNKHLHTLQFPSLKSTTTLREKEILPDITRTKSENRVEVEVDIAKASTPSLGDI